MQTQMRCIRHLTAVLGFATVISINARAEEPRAFDSTPISMADKISYISAEGLEKLKQELKELKTVRRREIASRIETAKALGDLSENAEYHEAKDEMAFSEGRVQEIEGILKNYSIIEKDTSNTTVHIGSTIEVEVGDKKKTFKIVGLNEAEPLQGLISNESPLGSAFLGQSKGDTVEVTTPGGAQKYTILSVS